MSCKKILSYVLSLSIVFSGIAFFSERTVNAAGKGVALNEKNFPDENFRNYIMENYDNYDYNNHCYEGYLSEDEIAQIDRLYIRGQAVSDLTGIEYFTSMVSLDCSNNKITKLDLSKNTALQQLDCSDNQLTELNLSNNKALTALNCSGNQLTKLDVSKNTALTGLNCSVTGLTKLDVSKNTALTQLNCNNNKLTKLDLSKNTKLTGLDISFNSLETIDISHNTYLLELLKIYEDYERIPSDHMTYETYSSQNYMLIIDKTTRMITKSSSPTPAPSGSGTSGFIDRLYSLVLGRPADQGGKDYWMNQVRNEGKTGADIAKGFLYSPEFLNKSMTDSEFLEILYNVFFDRPSDSGGKDYWLGKMAGGMSKQDVIMGFINSTEWANVCLTYGIPSGGTGKPSITIEPNEKIIAFATRLYSTCLGRKPEPAGLKDWSSRLANMQVSGTKAAEGFFFSSEFLGHNFDNAEFITRLYRTFMDREPDQGGYDYWMGRLSSGATRMEVFKGFADSKEFAKICSDYGILR